MPAPRVADLAGLADRRNPAYNRLRCRLVAQDGRQDSNSCVCGVRMADVRVAPPTGDQKNFGIASRDPIDIMHATVRD